MQRTMTRAELARAAERALREGFPHLAARASLTISERTIRYWTREGLLPPRGGPNRLGLYEPELVHRCVLIRRLRHERALALHEIRALLEHLDADTVRDVAAGGELPRIAPAPPPAAVDARSREGRGVRAAAADSSMPAARGAAPDAARGDDSADDHPIELHALSDQERIAALGKALRDLVGRDYTVSLLEIDYAPRVRPGSFRSPACIDVEITPSSRTADRETAIEDLQRITDEQLCDAIARELGACAQQPYRARLLLKRYARPTTLPQRSRASSLRLALLLGRDVGECAP